MSDPLKPWKNEPNHAEFHHAGLPCIIHRSRLGAWCGYVGVSQGHPDYEKHYDDIDVDVHGGLTYAEAMRDPVHSKTDMWWIGFDCCHSGDLAPKVLEIEEKNGLGGSCGHEGVYRNEAYVRAETRKLAEQLAARGAKAGT